MFLLFLNNKMFYNLNLEFLLVSCYNTHPETLITEVSQMSYSIQSHEVDYRKIPNLQQLSDDWVRKTALKNRVIDILADAMLIYDKFIAMSVEDDRCIVLQDAMNDKLLDAAFVVSVYNDV